MIKKVCLNVIALIFLVVSASSQTYVFKMQRERSVFWGYADVNGNVIIEPQYRNCNSFSEEGIASVFYEGDEKYEFINLKNEVLNIGQEGLNLQGAYGAGIRGFNSGMASYRIKKKWGAINSKGEIIFEPKYKKLSVFIDGYATAHANNAFYVLDNKGNEIQVATNDIEDLKKFCCGLAPYKNNKGLWGFINTKGEIAIQAQFKGVGYFNADLAWARTKSGDIGYINTTGEWVIAPKFSAVKDFDLTAGLAKVRIGELWGFSDREGNVFYLDLADKFYDFSEGSAKAVKDNLVGFLDKDFNWIIEPQFENARDFKNGFAAVKLNGGWGIIDKSGKWMVQPIYKVVKDVMVVYNNN